MKTTKQYLEQLNLHRHLIEDCKKGDRQAQFRLYRMYSKAMYNICLRMVNNEMDAEDLLQNSFIDVFRHLESFNFQSTPGAWIKRIVINNCINFLKKKKIHFEEISEYKMGKPETEIKNVRLNMNIFKESLSKLPEGYRAVFSLYQLEGYDHKEIAEILGVSESTSKSQYFRAKNKLKEIILSVNQEQFIS